MRTPTTNPTRVPIPEEERPIPTATKIRVLCVDDNRDVTAALRMCIEHEPDMESVGDLHSADDLVMQVEERRPDVVLLDMNMPGKDPLAALRQLTEASGGRRSVRVILFSGHQDEAVANIAAEAGACGFLPKHADVPVILEAIRGAARWRRGTDAFGVWP